MASSIPQELLDNFSSLLRENHPSPISIPPSLLLKQEDLAFYLVFKIFTRRQLRVEELRGSLSAAWNCRRLPPRVSVYHSNDIFLAKFDNKSDIDHIVEGAPWLVNGDLVSVQRCRPNTLPSAYPFNVSPFWVQLHGLPIDFLTAEVAVLLGNHLGSAARPSSEEVEKWSSFIRVRVEIDVSKPLVGSLPVALSSSNEEIITAQIKYENLPDYCRSCGMIGHEGEADHCPSRKSLEAATVAENQPDEPEALLRSRLSQPKYEHSLRAISFCLRHPGLVPAASKRITAEITEETGEIVCRRNSPQDLQLSAPANQVTRHGKSFDLEEVQGAQIVSVSLFGKMLSCIRPSVVTLNESESVILHETKMKVVLRMVTENAKELNKALKATVELPGVSAAKIEEDREGMLVVVGDGIDCVALIIKLRKRVGYAELISVGRPPTPVINGRQLFMNIRQYEDMRRYGGDPKTNRGGEWVMSRNARRRKANQVPNYDLC